MAFRNIVRVSSRLSGMSDCILHLPQVYLRHYKKSYVGKKIEHRSDLMPSTRKNTAFPDFPGPQISTKIHCDFTQIHCDFHQNTLWRQWRPLPALGRLRRFQDHSRGRRGDRYWPPHPRQQRFPLHF